MLFAPFQVGSVQVPFMQPQFGRVFTAGGGASYSSVVLADNPVAYWRLGESSGTSAADTSGNSRTGTYSGGYTLGTTGLITGDPNTAVTVDGSTGLVSVSDASALQFGTGDFSVEAWVNAAVIDAGNPAVQKTIVSKNSTGFELFIYQGKLRMYVGGSANTAGATTLLTSTRYHLVASRISGVLKTYINGILETTDALTASVSASGTGINLGQRPGGGAGTIFSGVLDEVALYATGLTSAQVLAHYVAGF